MRQSGKPGEEQQSDSITAGRIVRGTEHRREEESPEPAYCSDDARDDTHTVREALRHELEDGAIADPQRPTPKKSTTRMIGSRGSVEVTVSDSWPQPSRPRRSRR